MTDQKLSKTATTQKPAARSDGPPSPGSGPRHDTGPSGETSSIPGSTGSSFLSGKAVSFAGLAGLFSSAEPTLSGIRADAAPRIGLDTGETLGRGGYDTPVRVDVGEVHSELPGAGIVTSAPSPDLSGQGSDVPAGSGGASHRVSSAELAVGSDGSVAESIDAIVEPVELPVFDPPSLSGAVRVPDSDPGADGLAPTGTTSDGGQPPPPTDSESVVPDDGPQRDHAAEAVPSENKLEPEVDQSEKEYAPQVDQSLDELDPGQGTPQPQPVEPPAAPLVMPVAVAEGEGSWRLVAHLSMPDGSPVVPEFWISDAQGTPIEDTPFVIDGDRVLIGPGTEFDFETPSQSFHVVAIGPGGSSEPSSTTLEVLDRAEHHRLGDGGVVFVDVGVAEHSLLGGAGGDHITAYDSDADAVIRGGGGSDTILGNAGDDDLGGDAGNDTIFGHSGNDYLHGGTGDDYLHGGAGDDLLEGGEGDDTLDGDVGHDTLRGGEGNDRLIGWLGDDTLEGGEGDDLLDGGEGNDRLFGGAGNDEILAWLGSDYIEGGDGDDYIHAGAGGAFADQDGADEVYGGAGNDRIIGGAGDDRLFGGEGSDVFVMSSKDGSDQISGGDGWTDLIELQGVSGPVVVSGRSIEGTGWTAQLDEGHGVTGQSDGRLELSDDTSGVITFDDGATANFAGIEGIHW